MSDAVKLIVELPKTTYQEVIENRDTSNTNIYNAILNGTPLEDVKAEIFDKAIKDASGEGFIFLGRLLRIFDNIGKTESEARNGFKNFESL